MTKKLLLTILQLQLLAPALFAAVPQRWTVETSRVKPAQFDAYHGETLDLEATFLSYGLPLALPPDADCRIFWQTNGMGNVYWSTNAVLVSSNAIAAVFQPTFDPGATTVLGFIGIPASNYRAAFTIRFRGSPGATPFNPPPFPMAEYYTKPEVDARISSATNALRRVDGAARPLPPYLHAIDYCDTYPEEAAEYYASRHGEPVGCSVVVNGGFMYRNFDFPFDERAEFVVRVTSGPDRFASIGVANVGTNLTESAVTSGKWSPCYKWLPGAVTDGINEHSVAVEINVVDGVPQWHTNGVIHPLAAVRWTLDHATNAQHAAEFLASNIRFPDGWEQNYHYMIADQSSIYIVHNGEAREIVVPPAIMTNFRIFPSRSDGPGQERYALLAAGESITNAWYTRAYAPDAEWISEFHGDTNLMAAAKELWAAKPREQHRGESHDGYTWWQTVHTSIYDITNKVLRVAVQEQDDWYTFAIVWSSADITFAETDPTVPDWAKDPTPPLPGGYETVSNRAMTALQEHQSLDDYYTRGETDARIIELAPAPGDYETVSNRAMTALQEHQSLDDYYTRGETDAKIIELAPAPGDYETVSNRAMTALQEHQSLDDYYTQSETDARIIELAPAPGNYATVSNRAMTALQEHQSLDDYYTRGETDARIIELAPAPGDYETVSNRAMTAVQPSAATNVAEHVVDRAQMVYVYNGTRTVRSDGSGNVYVSEVVTGGVWTLVRPSTADLVLTYGGMVSGKYVWRNGVIYVDYNPNTGILNCAAGKLSDIASGLNPEAGDDLGGPYTYIGSNKYVFTPQQPLFPDLPTTRFATANEVSLALAGKQDTISDLATIRSGAALGATALPMTNGGSSVVYTPSGISIRNSSLAAGYDSVASDVSVAIGVSASAASQSFVWSFGEEYSQQQTCSFNICPLYGIAGFFIGSRSMADYLGERATTNDVESVKLSVESVKLSVDDLKSAKRDLTDLFVYETTTNSLSPFFLYPDGLILEHDPGMRPGSNYDYYRWTCLHNGYLYEVSYGHGQWYVYTPNITGPYLGNIDDMRLEFAAGLLVAERKSIYVPVPTAVTLVTSVDLSAATNLIWQTIGDVNLLLETALGD